MEPKFKDLFSKNSKQYASARPAYPKELFEFVVGLCSRRSRAWDCATGNGQAAAALADYFDEVIASDISVKQLENARKRSNVKYEVFPAEKANIGDDSVDLVTVAQAVHWFDFERFYVEAKRVLRKGTDGKGSGVIAVWAYGLNTITALIDKITYHLYEEILGDKYWPRERKYVESRLKTIPFPFDELAAPTFTIELNWNLQELINYYHTWSSVQKYFEKNNSDPVLEVYSDLEKAWGGKESLLEKKVVTWPIYLRVGRITTQ